MPKHIARALYEIVSYHLEEIQKALPGTKVQLLAAYEDNPKKSLMVGDLDPAKAIEIIHDLMADKEETLVIDQGFGVNVKKD